MLSAEQKKLLETIAAAWAKKPRQRFGLFLVEANSVWGEGQLDMSTDESIQQAVKDYVGLK